jgi:hypothetical protein
MTTKKTTDETESEEPTEEVAVEVPAEEVDNSKHDKPLYTGDLGGSVLLSSTDLAE